MEEAKRKLKMLIICGIECLRTYPNYCWDVGLDKLSWKKVDSIIWLMNALSI